MSYQAKIKRYLQILQLIEKSKYPTSAEMLDRMSETGIKVSDRQLKRDIEVNWATIMPKKYTWSLLSRFIISKKEDLSISGCKRNSSLIVHYENTSLQLKK